MTKKEAKEILKYHSFTHEDIDHPKSKRGFLGMLRPFTGELIEENFHEVITAIKTISDELRTNEKIDREVIIALWGICHFTRNWAINPEGMLQRNGLIEKQQIKLLEVWIETISYATFSILEGSDNLTAFDLYKNQSN
ncbi:hypothetical protein [Aureibacter tunicatorum]|uniref:Uncharacterized protein n=1 Tax=Aureibacter tunicatorum TaxID=866807 RepID=A0AAE3XP30_9BACT|nr:hypothetical protein [Aureibacter tunicatorum]MDR6239513.1 hypothetical protein [Aureibacter tunicatorum]BDD03990.1 hypothetical protein AUTU_14730 [Aureibacter tunicatorum]